jgi:ribosome-associated toxin RatA of RatAB toxin-antitoxin module
VRSVLEVDIAAPAELVFTLVRDPGRWPQMLPHYVRARVLASGQGDVRTMEFVARRPFLPWLGVSLPVAWRSRTWSDPERLELRFIHVGGPTAGMSVTWRIVPSRDACTVSIEHQFDRGPSVYPRLVDRLFTRPIAGRTLATFKTLAETLTEVWASHSGRESAPSIPTNQQA